MNKPYEDPAVYEVIRAWCASCGYARPSDGDCMALAAALSPTRTACKGMNCAASAANGFTHSPECLAEHSAAIDGLKRPWPMEEQPDGTMVPVDPSDISPVGAIEVVVEEWEGNGRANADAAMDRIADLVREAKP